GSDVIHGFPAGAVIQIPFRIIGQLIHGIGLLAPDVPVLVTVEVIVLDITGDAFPFQPAVVLLAAVSRIGGDIGRLAVIADMLLQVRDERGGVGCALVDAVGSDILVIGADLYIVGRFELAVSHVVLLHPHEGGIRIGLAIALAAFAKDLLLPGIAFKGAGPPVFRIVQLLLHFLVNFGSAALQRIVD